MSSEGSLFAIDLVNQQFADAMGYANSAWSMTQSFLSQLGDTADFDVPFSNLEYSFPNINVGEYKYNRPDWTPGSITLDSLPPDPDIRNISIPGAEIRNFTGTVPVPTATRVTLGNIPEFTEHEPTLTELTVDDVDVPTFNLVPPAPTAKPDIPVPSFDDFTDEKPILTASTITPIDIPDFSEDPPELTFGTNSEIAMPDDPGNPPEVEDVDLPTKPVKDMPTAPVFSDIVIPPAPTDIQNHVFEGVFPTEIPEPPGNLFIYNESEYSSELKTGLQTYLLNKINNLNTTDAGSITYDPSAPQHVQYQQVLNGLLGIGGLDAVTEAAIWNRAIEREALKHEAAYQEAERYYSVRSWKIPPGALSGRLLQVQAEKDRGLTTINAEILIRQTDLIYKTIEIAVSNGIQLEKACMDYSNNVAQRAFESAKYVQEAAIQIYNALSAHYSQQLEAYKTQAAVLESLLRSESLKLERHKLELEGAGLSLDIQMREAKIYETQVQFIETLWKIYATEMEGSKLQLEAGRQRLESFHEKVNVFTASIGAVTAQYNARQARMAAETEKARMYESEARAYEAMISGLKSKADIRIAQAKGNNDIELSKLQVYDASLRAHLSGIEAEKIKSDVNIAQAKAEVDIDSFKLQAFDTQTKGYLGLVDISKTRAGLEMERLRQNVSIQQLELQKFSEQIKAYMGELEGAKIREDLKIANQKSQSEYDKVNAEIYASQVRGFTAYIEGEKIKSDVNIAQSQIEIERNKHELEKYTLLLQPIDMDLKRQIAELESNARMYGYEIDGYKSDLQFSEVQINADIKSYEAQTTHESNELALQLKEAETNLQAAMSAHALQVESIRAGLTAMAQLTASALNSVNAAASMGYSESVGFSNSWDWTKQEPTTSHNHFYNETESLLP
jgi:hypothetical protein